MLLALHAPKLFDLDCQLKRRFLHHNLVVISLGTSLLHSLHLHHSNSIDHNNPQSDRRLTTANLSLTTLLFEVLKPEFREDSTSYSEVAVELPF